jgi:hypothetical protein
MLIFASLLHIYLRHRPVQSTRKRGFSSCFATKGYYIQATISMDRAHRSYIESLHKKEQVLSNTDTKDHRREEGKMYIRVKEQVLAVLSLLVYKHSLAIVERGHEKRWIGISCFPLVLG